MSTARTLDRILEDYKKLAWSRYQEHLRCHEVPWYKLDRSDFEDEYCGTYDSIATYMYYVYLPQLTEYPEHDNQDEYSNVQEHADGLRDAGILWWITEQNGKVHVFEYPE